MVALKPSVGRLLIHCRIQHVRLLRRRCFSATKHDKASIIRRLNFCRCLRFLDILLFEYYLELVDGLLTLDHGYLSDGRPTAVRRPSGRVLKNVARLDGRLDPCVAAFRATCSVSPMKFKSLGVP